MGGRTSTTYGEDDARVKLPCSYQINEEQNVRDELHIVGSFNYCIIFEIHSKIHCLGYAPMVPHISFGCLFRFINTKKLWLRGDYIYP